MITDQECLELLKEHNVPDNIIKHSKKVRAVAVFLGKKLIEKGENINLELLNAATLLHDLDKLQTRDPALINHGLITHKILSEKGLKEIAEIIRSHNPSYFLKSDHNWEVKLMQYADSRCLEDNVVSLEERYAYAFKTYPNLDIKQLKAKLLKVETEIFNKLDIKPEDLT